MARKSDSTPAHAPSKPAKPVVGNNRPQRSYAAKKALIDLGIPPQIADTFPLTPHHGNKAWCKKILGKIWYFGKFVDGWQAALDLFEEQKTDLYAGRTPHVRKPGQEGLRLLDLCNRFLFFKRGLISEGTLTMRSWYDYHQGCQRVMKVFGENRIVETIRPEDFEELRRDFGKTWGPVRIGNEISRTRILFNYAFEQELIEKPVRFGQAFKRPDRKTLRKVKAQSGPRMYEREEIQTILGAATPAMKAMVLLGINCGFGNNDCATLPLSALDLEKGWVRFPRPKTGVERNCPLWPETIQAIKDWLAVRPEPKVPEGAQLVFLTKQRRPWYRVGRFVTEEKDNGETLDRVKGVDNPLAKSFKVLLDNVGINGRRGFYSLRHGFETIAGDTGDQVAVNAIMGHADQSMAGVYRERIDPSRLVKVTDHVRAWLFHAA